MIVVDSSIIVGIMQDEPDTPAWLDVLDGARKSLMSVVAYVETHMVIAGRRSDPDAAKIADLLKVMRVEVVPVSLEQGTVAIASFMRYGKGRHRARLNLADCFSYALAKSRELPLLFKGDDFSKTDIVPAWRP
jgi:ribonuclease VapC